MNTFNAEALEYEELYENRTQRALDAEPRFEVVTGGGLDARARAGVSSQFLARVKMVVAGAVLIFALGSMRVALTSLTVSQLTSNAQMREQITSYETSNDNLRVERSLMASATRIDRIAAQNYGMVNAASYDVIVLETEEEASAEEVAEADAAADEEAEAAVEAEAPAADHNSTLDTAQLAADL